MTSWHISQEIQSKAYTPTSSLCGGRGWENRATPISGCISDPRIPWKLSLRYILFNQKRLQTMLWHHNARVNSHQRWKQTRFRICFHLWRELTSTMRCNGMTRFLEFMLCALRIPTPLCALPASSAKFLSIGKTCPKQSGCHGNSSMSWWPRSIE